MIIGAVVVIAIALSLNGCSDSQDSTDVGDVESADNAEYELHLKVHHVAFGNYHTCLVIVSDSNHTRYISVNDKYKKFEWLNYSDSEDSKFFTIGAGGAAGFVGTLEARYNRSKDKELEIAVEFTKLGAYNADKIQKIINYHEYYMSHKNPRYEARPDPKDKSYNCNSYTHGLLNVVNISCNQSTFNTPGWSKPLPAKYFGA